MKVLCAVLMLMLTAIPAFGASDGFVEMRLTHQGGSDSLIPAAELSYHLALTGPLSAAARVRLQPGFRELLIGPAISVHQNQMDIRGELTLGSENANPGFRWGIATSASGDGTHLSLSGQLEHGSDTWYQLIARYKPWCNIGRYHTRPVLEAGLMVRRYDGIGPSVMATFPASHVGIWTSVLFKSGGTSTSVGACWNFKDVPF